VSTLERTLRNAPDSVAPSAVERIAVPLLERALGHLEHGTLEVTLPNGARRRFGEGPHVTMEIASDQLFRRIATRGSIGLGESYQAGEWTSDDLPHLVELLFRNLESASARHPRLARVMTARPRPNRRQGLLRMRRHIQYHYDLGNPLFELMLDETMTYSCAIFERPDEPLADAQRRKLRRVCDRLELSADDHVLEIGCGWGSFALTAAGEYGARVTGVTLSQQQLELARERVAAAGLADRVEILGQDYRTLEGQFSKLASIEMLEAIGYAQYPTFFAACDRLLAPGGLAAIQVIGMPDQRFERYRRKEDWIQRYIFPGSLLPSLEALQTAMSRASGLMVVGLEEIGPHYADTLGAWRERFFASLAEVRALGFDDRFIRIWDFYLASCEALFRARAIRDMQLVLGRPFEEPA
jgi:cyclopropane-fatty-acyl-phospholipid synthase